MTRAHWSQCFDGDQGDLFSWTDDEWRYEEWVSVDDIEWSESVVFVCEHCKQAVALGAACGGCGSKSPVREGSLGMARARLIAFLPGGLHFFTPPDRMAIIYKRCGQRNDPTYPDMTITLQTLRIVRRKISRPMTTRVVDAGIGPGDLLAMEIEI